MNVSEALNEAADRIERDGWWGGTGGGEYKGASPVCAANSIYKVICGSGDIRLLLTAQEAFWKHIGGDDLPDIWHWNDAPDRTAAEVVEALRACAVIEAARETDVRVVEPREAVSPTPRASRSPAWRCGSRPTKRYTKVGPLLFPHEGGTVADTLRMLGDLAVSA